MSPKQEPKYRAVADFFPENDGLQPGITTGYLINRSSGEKIPDDEPVFVLRARDRFAADAIRKYYELCAAHVDVGHRVAVWTRYQDFQDFALLHPDRMKTPDTEQSK